LNLSLLNRTAAEVAAASFFEKFPGVELLGGKRTSLGFSFDFCLASSPPPEIEILIEEGMRQIIREKRQIRVLEMVPFSARELLLKEGHAARADELYRMERKGLVEIVQIGGFYNLSPGPHLSCTSEIGAFKLWPMQRIEDHVYRLSGTAFPTKEELKQFLKAYRDYPEKSHERIGFKKSLWHLLDGIVVWLPAGLERKRAVIEAIRASLFQGALEISLSVDSDRKILHQTLTKEMGTSIAEIYDEPSPPWDSETGLFAGTQGTRVLVSHGTSLDWEGKVISSLQSIGKTLNLLGFQHRLRFSGRKRSGKIFQGFIRALESQGMEVEMLAEEPGSPRLDYLVGDHLGRQWAAFSIELAANGLFITASVERLVALLLEMNSHKL
jgi:alanyl-tRNA synthetase